MQVDGELREIAGVLFDMDGTIVDSGAVTDRTWQAWAQRHGVTDRLEILHGTPAATTVLACMPDVTDERLAELVEEQSIAERADLDGVRAMPGALELIAWLDDRGIPWAVVTSADRLLATARLEASGIYPTALITCDDILNGKPHPEPFLRGAQALGLHISACLVVEDAPAGVRAGLASGAVTAALNGHEADVAISSIAHLHDLLEPAG